MEGAAAPRPDSFTFFLTRVHLGCAPTTICSSLKVLLEERGLGLGGKGGGGEEKKEAEGVLPDQIWTSSS